MIFVESYVDSITTKSERFCAQGALERKAFPFFSNLMMIVRKRSVDRIPQEHYEFHIGQVVLNSFCSQGMEDIRRRRFSGYQLAIPSVLAEQGKLF